jgi:hypothetical protein
MSGSLADFSIGLFGSGTITGTDGADVLPASGGDATLQGGGEAIPSSVEMATTSWRVAE